jgi:chaperone modulatory protein CbpM
MTDDVNQSRPNAQPGAAGIRITLAELSLAHAASVEQIVELVMEGVLEPTGDARDDWRFSELHFHHTGIAMRLQRDLGVNVPGVALALQLLDEVQALRVRLAALSGDGV